MECSLIYHPEVAKKDLPEIPANIKTRIRTAIEERLLNDPVKYGAPLRWSLKGFRKLRIGDYRVIYTLQKNRITILKIGRRKEVYSAVLTREIF